MLDRKGTDEWKRDANLPAHWEPQICAPVQWLWLMLATPLGGGAAKHAIMQKPELRFVILLGHTLKKFFLNLCATIKHTEFMQSAKHHFFQCSEVHCVPVFYQAISIMDIIVKENYGLINSKKQNCHEGDLADVGITMHRSTILPKKVTIAVKYLQTSINEVFKTINQRNFGISCWLQSSKLLLIIPCVR